MKLAGRAAAAIEVLAEIFERHRPASEALKDWGKAHRFAGSSDRHAIGTLVYDALRKRNSLAAATGSASPRLLVLAVLRHVWTLEPGAIASLAEEQHGPGKLSTDEMTALSTTVCNVPPNVAGDFPEWLTPSFQRAFGEMAAEEGAALAERAPIDLRVNTLKAARPQVLAALKRFGAVEGPLSPHAVRIAAPDGYSRNSNVEAEPAHGLGWFEVQDAASQVAALMAGARPSESVADICAGAGGKTLALAAAMQNKGRLIAHDADRHRLRPIFERIGRSGASIIEVVAAEEKQKLASLGPYDSVLIDAPCSGSGSWRRKPDAKWRLTEKQLQQRLKDQRQVLENGFELVRPGGRLVYMTCSVLPEENSGQVEWFLAAHQDMKIIPYKEQWASAIGGEAPKSADSSETTLLLTPRQHGTDGFFMAVMRRN
jgi:16S rRNA (cytosine967-C5)-methyltransferase